MGDAPTGVVVAMGNGDGTFQTPAFFPAQFTSNAVGANQIALGDVNQDGIPDIVTSGGTTVSSGSRFSSATAKAGSPRSAIMTSTAIMQMGPAQSICSISMATESWMSSSEMEARSSFRMNWIIPG